VAPLVFPDPGKREVPRASAAGRPARRNEPSLRKRLRGVPTLKRNPNPERCIAVRPPLPVAFTKPARRDIGLHRRAYCRPGRHAKAELRRTMPARRKAKQQIALECSGQQDMKTVLALLLASEPRERRGPRRSSRGAACPVRHQVVLAWRALWPCHIPGVRWCRRRFVPCDVGSQQGEAADRSEMPPLARRRSCGLRAWKVGRPYRRPLGCSGPSGRRRRLGGGQGGVHAVGVVGPSVAANAGPLEEAPAACGNVVGDLLGVGCEVEVGACSVVGGSSALQILDAQGCW